MPVRLYERHKARSLNRLRLSSDLFSTNGTLRRASSLVPPLTDAPHDLPQVRAGRGEVSMKPTHIKHSGFILLKRSGMFDADLGMGHQWHRRHPKRSWVSWG